MFVPLGEHCFDTQYLFCPPQNPQGRTRCCPDDGLESARWSECLSPRCHPATSRQLKSSWSPPLQQPWEHRKAMSHQRKHARAQPKYDAANIRNQDGSQQHKHTYRQTGEWVRKSHLVPVEAAAQQAWFWWVLSHCRCYTAPSLYCRRTCFPGNWCWAHFYS